MKLNLKMILLPALLLAVACSTPATEAPTADPTPQPVATEAPPTATAVPEPTSTSEPTAVPTATAVPTEAAAPQSVLFTPVNPPDQPMLPRPEAADSPFASIYTDVGAVVYHEGVFHLFYNTIHGWPPREIPVGYATSPDGVNWTREVDEPLFQAEDVSYAGHTLLVSSALVEDDGTWVLYFYTWPTMSTTVASAIGRITAPEPTGPWTADETPALEASGEGWDDYSVANPYVIKHEDGAYSMYYTGHQQGNRESAIGLATSTDGLSWTKHGESVLQAGEAPWSQPKISGPKVLPTESGWLMIYRNDPVTGVPTTLGYATSPDGLTWSHTSQETPIFDITAYKQHWRAVWSADIAHVNDTYFLFLEIGTGSSTDAHVMTYEGTFGNQLGN